MDYFFWLMKKSGGARNADRADEDPKRIQQRVGEIAFQHGAPRQQHGVAGVDDPDEHERALRAEPAHDAETADAHQHAGQFKRFEIFANEKIQDGKHDLNGGDFLVQRINAANSAADGYLSLTREATSFNFNSHRL
jgi:hypothetical protein